ncbi:hypothetical protein BC830DRAFT_303937 [Chytriomyces sp. MP71]|nr:hypothetical protein BC830DRAFT_303937 [Chytriomyces sp. MP71]
MGAPSFQSLATNHQLDFLNSGSKDGWQGLDPMESSFSSATEHEDTFLIYDAFSSRHFKLVTPQAELMHNLAARIAHLVRKGTMKAVSPTAMWNPIDDLAAIMRLHPVGSVTLKDSKSGSKSAFHVASSSSRSILALTKSVGTQEVKPETERKPHRQISVSLGPEAGTTLLEDIASKTLGNKSQDFPRPLDALTIEDIMSEAESEAEKMERIHIPSRSRSRATSALSSFQGVGAKTDGDGCGFAKHSRSKSLGSAANKV